MAEQNHLLATLRETVALYDDDALSALANKGLLRRAYKDLESTTLTVLEDGDGVRIDVGEAVVTLAVPLQTSRCTCPASGVCRHILLALLWLKQEAPVTDAPAADTSPGDEICALTDEVLQRWASKPLLRKAMQRLANGLPVTWEEGQTINFAFPDQELTCRWLPGQGPEGMVCDCHAPQCCEHRVMALLAYQASRGLREITAEVESTPREAQDRTAVLEAIGVALCELVGHGLSHLSPASYERIFTLSISVHGADLPRMERLLKSLATEIQLQLDRDAQADSANLLTAAARIEALRLALQNPTSALLGQHRSAYTDVKQFDLLGMGAAKWQTKSRFVGLTVYFWNLQSGQWMSWSDARPANSPDGFSPAKRLHAAGPWGGCLSPADISRKRLTLRNAGRNAVGRISGREETVATVTAVGASGGPEPITVWDVIAERAIILFSAGSQDRDERDGLLYVEPAKWGTPSFQEIRQELVLPLLDARGKSLPLVVPYDDDATDMMAILEGFKWTPGTRVLGSLRFRASGVYLEPLVLYQGERTINLTLDRPPKESTLLKRVKALLTRLQPPAPAAAPLTGIGAMLDSALGEVEIIAEGGVSAYYDTTRLEELAAACSAVGLTLAATNITLLITSLGMARHTLTPNPVLVAQHLLHGYHVLRQTRIMDTLLQATTGLR